MSHPQPAAARFDDPVLAAMAARRSISKVGPQTPSDNELLALLDAVTPVADHKALKPWRLLTIRGDDRLRLGAALDAAAGREPGDKPNPKPSSPHRPSTRRFPNGSNTPPPPAPPTYSNSPSGRPGGV